VWSKVVSTVTESFRKVRFFLADVQNELRKSTWPTRGELIESTIVVIVSVILFAIYIGLCDTVLRKCMEFLARH
jgi:preprotein translocase subunit SecE